MTNDTSSAATAAPSADNASAPSADNASAASADNASATSEKPLNIGTFDTKDPNAWFFRAEMMFRIRAVLSEKRKAELVMECLPPACWNVMAKFFEETTSPTYTQVKEELLEHWDTKPAARAKQFFAHLGSSAGDTNVSTMYHTLDTLTTIPKTTTREKSALNIVMEMTLQMYPKQVRAQLPDYASMDTKEFLRQADRILAAYAEPSILAAAAAAPDSEDETAEIAAPTRPRVDSTRYPRPTQQQQQQQTQPFPRRKKKTDTCFYHTRFGDKAFRCQPPCRFQKNE